jgi:hypothetical protein
MGKQLLHFLQQLKKNAYRITVLNRKRDSSPASACAKNAQTAVDGDWS